MHGRKKLLIPPTQAELENLRKKKSTYSTLVDMIFHRRNNFEFSEESLEITAKMLLSSPDFYSIWNFRREILINLHGEKLSLSSELSMGFKISSGGLANAVRDRELQLSADCIRKNTKSYGAWHHRLWIIQRFEIDLNSELDLCRDFLKLDERNFHCWNYRRAVASLFKASPMSEFSFAEEKIYENFSNYSAFHHRSAYILHLDVPIRDILEAELSIVENAIFTEPDDQSAWWYQHFLVALANKQFIAAGNHQQLSWFIGVLRKQLSLIDNLLELESNSKWCLTARAEFGSILGNALVLVTNESKNDELDRELSILLEMRRESLFRLCEIDGAHKNRYLYLLNNK